MGLYKNNNGVLEPIAGRGKAEYGASTIRTGQASLTMLENQGSYANAKITFAIPMPDANYEVILSKPDIAYYQTNINVTNKTVNGFYITASSFVEMQSTVWSSIKVDWCAFKLYTDNEYNNLLSAIPSTAGASNKLVDTNTLNEKAPDTDWASTVSGFSYRKKNGIVFLHMAYTISTAQTSDWSVPTPVLPEGFRPSKSVFGVANKDSDNSLITVKIELGGIFRFYKTPATVTQIDAGKYNGYYSFPVD